MASNAAGSARQQPVAGERARPLPRREARPGEQRQDIPIELGFVRWEPVSVELRTDTHQARASSYGYLFYAAVVFHGLHGRDALGLQYIWPHACRRRNPRGQLLPPHVTVIRELEATAEEIEHLTEELRNTLGIIGGRVYTTPSEFAFYMEGGINPQVRTFARTSPLHYMLSQLRYEIYHWLLRRDCDPDRVVHLPDAHLWL